MVTCSVPTARDVMVEGVIAFSPETPIRDALRSLISLGISGGPVLDRGRLVGIVSEKDCLRLVADGAFHGIPHGRLVRDYMTTEVRTIDPDTDIFTIAGLFLANPFRRLPVLDGDQLVGQVSRRDVLVGIERMHREAARDRSRSYPDYRSPV